MLWFAFCFFSIVFGAPRVKNLAGPPADFGFHRIPDPASAVHIARSMSKSIWFGDLNISGTNKIDDTKPLYKTTLPVDGTKGVTLAFASPAYEQLKAVLKDSQGNIVKGNIVSDYFHIGDQTTVPAATFAVEQPVLGSYSFELFSNGLTGDQIKALASNPYADAVLLLLVDNDVKIASHLLSYEFKPGSKVGLVSTIIVDGHDNALQAGVRNVVINSASMMVTNPFGDVETVIMNDLGLEEDKVAGDGKFTGAVIAKHPGIYLVEARLNGNLDDPIGIEETPFQRTTQHFLRVSDVGASLYIGGHALLSSVDSKRYALNVTVVGAAGLSQATIRAYTELHAKKTDGTVVPICWVGGIVYIDEKTSSFALMVDKRWLADAGITAQDKLFIQQTYLSDVDTSFPIASFFPSIDVDLRTDDLLQEIDAVRNKEGKRSREEEKEMRRGVRPVDTVRVDADAGAPEALINLVLLPGYCAEVNPWTRKHEDFTNGFYPVKYGNFPNDEYAHYMMEQIAAQNVTKFGIVAHSQGGMVATHIHNYYWTGLEDATGGKLIQTLGTPFQGTSASGSMANLAKVFGIACGTNTDLSRDGAANWLSGISMDTRQDVYSYGSTYGGGDHYFDYCSLAMNLLLQWPNDGVTEHDYSELPGGHWEGFVNMWCHTTEMTYPPQYDDVSRNVILNKNAAR